MFEDLFDLNNDNIEQTELHEKEVWDTGAVWDTGETPDNVWKTN